MSNEVTDKSLEKLLEYYKSAKESVIENIRAVRQRNGNDFYLRQALTQIEKELDKLYKQNKKWFEQQSELAFRRGYNQFSREIGRTASVEGAVNFVKMNNDAVEMLSQSAASNIGDALRQIKYNALYVVNKIGRRQDDVIADVGIKASAEALAVNAPSAAREQIIRDLAEKDIFSVTYRNGAKVSVEDYASMVARTTTHEAAATAKLIAAEQEGYDLVKMSTHYPTCKTCAQLQGRVYSISGKDKRFPPLSKAFKSGYNTVHPNCRHVVSVWAEEIKTDEEIKEASENSLKPFDTDPRSEKERELYSEQQAYWRDMQQYKSYLLVIEYECPKNFKEFQRIKYEDKKEYGILKAQKRGMLYYNKAIANEPEISKIINQIALEEGLDIVGFEYRIKSKQSYLRKIRANYSEKDNQYEITDIIRYTYTANSEELVKKTTSAIENFSEKGYNTIKVKNYWLDKNNPYNGINTTIRAANGQKFEVQYHTPESFELKNGNLHKIYEEWRILKPNDSKRKKLEEKMKELSGTLVPPNGIEGVK